MLKYFDCSLTDTPNDDNLVVAVGVSFGLGIPCLLAVILTFYRISRNKRCC